MNLPERVVTPRLPGLLPRRCGCVVQRSEDNRGRRSHYVCVLSIWHRGKHWCRWEDQDEQDSVT